MKTLLALFFFSTALYAASYQLPATFDLRNVGGKNLVTSVKAQQGGTCWTHGVMAAIEGNLAVSNAWTSAGETGEPALAEYHLDWWNGFNDHFNGDVFPEKAGIPVHRGGDYRIAAAYLARGAGAVRKVDAQSFEKPPAQMNASYHSFYVGNIEWFSATTDLTGIDRIKNAIASQGVIGTALTWSSSFYSAQLKSFYQPHSNPREPNHAVAIVGWDDNRVTQAPLPGAWLAKNSWGTGFGDKGFFWISYYDKTAGHHPNMGAVSFRSVTPFRFNRIYSHDYHGWRDTKEEITEAFNAFTAVGNHGTPEFLKAISFYTAQDRVSYTARVFTKFEKGELGDEIAAKYGFIQNTGFHTAYFTSPVPLKSGQKFYIYLQLQEGGQPFDRTSEIPLLLGGGTRTLVVSKAKPGESYYRKGTVWKDLTEDDPSANFCMKGLTIFNKETAVGDESD